MPTLLTATNLEKTYGTHTLFTGVSLGLDDGDRLGVIGPNGAGKSTLLKTLAGLETPDDGDIVTRNGLRAAYVRQTDDFPDNTTPSHVVTQAAADFPDAEHVFQLDPATRAGITLSRLGFDHPDQPVATLSGGWRKRLSLAAALVNEPDMLLLDEPTNHLDLEGVQWLEDFVVSHFRGKGAVVFITHDRVFLESAAQRVLELSRAYPDGTLEVKGNYSEFVRRKAEFLDGQATQQTALAGKVRRDTAWLKQGIQGRQTRNRSQMKDADRRRDELEQLKNRNAAPTKVATIDFQATERKTKKLLAAHNLTKSLGGRKLIHGLDLQLSPGMRLGLLGPNGVGKTTLLRLLTGELAPDAGTVKPAAELRIVNFTQHRETLDPTESLRSALCPVGDTVDYRGKPVHVAGWARRFLFDPSQFNTSVGDLSGGEQARILIANLMLKPADVLILDEPTNDLDIASLEVLEDTLSEFPGALVLVTHDRFMLRRLSTELLALHGDGTHGFYASYAQWLDAQQTRTAPKPRTERSEAPAPSTKTDRAAGKTSRGKLTYKLQRELDGMEDAILAAEARIEELTARASDPQVIADHAAHAKVCAELGEAHGDVKKLYDRWAELESMSDA